MQRPGAKRPAAITLTRINKEQKGDSSEEPKISPTKHQRVDQNKNDIQAQSPRSPDSPTRRKRNPTFVTQKKISQVDQAFGQLHSYIDVIDEKVVKLVEKHEAEFLVAYRNHVKRVRQEMEEIKRKAMSNADSSVSHAQKIETLQKQLSIFRQQSLKLFQKLDEKQKTVYYLNSKISELQSEKLHLEESLRSLTKRNKYLEGSRLMEIRNQQTSSNLADINKQFQIHRPYMHEQSEEQAYLSNYNIISEKSNLIKNRPYTTAINSKGASVRTRNQSIQLSRPQKNIDNTIDVSMKTAKIDQILGELDQNTALRLKKQIERVLLNNEKQLKMQQSLFRTTLQSRKGSFTNKNSKSLIDSKIKANKSQLEQFFYQSIETVRKQITRRRGLKSLNFYKQYSNLSLSEFKKVDFFRILQIMVGNDKIIAAVHQAIFQEASRFT